MSLWRDGGGREWGEKGKGREDRAGEGELPWIRFKSCRREKTIQQYTWKGMLSYVGVLPKVTELQKYNIDLDSIDPGIPEGNVCY